MEKGNKNNNLRKSTAHYTPEMSSYVKDLWMQGTNEYVIDRLIRKKLTEKYRERVQKRIQKSA